MCHRRQTGPDIPSAANEMHSTFRRGKQISGYLRTVGRCALVAVVGIVLVLFGPAAQPASAAPSNGATTTIQAQINAQLRATSGGVQISRNEIAWHDRTAVMEFPDGAAALAQRCPNGWSCFFEHDGWGGRMLKFCSCDVWRHFSDYGFNNQTSSWHNALGKSVEVNDDDAPSPIHLWNEDANARSSYVGDWANDRADVFQIHC